MNKKGDRYPVLNGSSAGPAGVGVPVGGATSQVLAKASAADYDTDWVTPSSGGSDGLSYVSANDTTPGYLNGKLLAGTNISLVENNDGANEYLSISFSGFAPGIDSSAIHRDVPGEINTLTTKVTPASADFIMIEDSAATNNKKKITVGAIPHNSLAGYEANRHIDWTAASAGTIHSTNYSSVDTTAIHKAISGEIAALTLKATLVGTDVILVEDSAASNSKKRTTVSGIPHNSLSGYEVNRHIDWTAASAGTIHATNYSSTDANAIHGNVASEIFALTAKVAPTDADMLIIEDAAAGYAKKKTTIGLIPHNSLAGYEANRHIDWTAASAGTIHPTNYSSGGTTDSDAIHKNVAAEISTITAKATPVGADLILIEDSAATNAKKKITISTIPHNSLSGYEANRHIDWTAVSAGTIHSSNYSVSVPTLQSTWNANGTSLVTVGTTNINWRLTDTYKFTVQEPSATKDTFRVSAAAAGDKVEIDADNFNVVSTNTIDFNTMLKVSSTTPFPATLSTQLLDFTNGSEATIRTGGDIGFIDSYKTASTNTTKLKVAGSTTEWETFYGKFGAVSLIKAIDMAQGWTTVKLTSDFSYNGTAQTGVTGWLFTPAAGKVYEFEVMSLCTTSATTTGIRLGVLAMGGTITSGAIITSPLTTATSTTRHTWGTSAQNSTSTGTPATVPHLITVKGMIISGATPTGNFQISLSTEVAASSVSITAGSFFRWREII